MSANPFRDILDSSSLLGSLAFPGIGFTKAQLERMLKQSEIQGGTAIHVKLGKEEGTIEIRDFEHRHIKPCMIVSLMGAVTLDI